MRRPRSRLAWLIYIAGLAQAGAVVLGFLLFLHVRMTSDRQTWREACADVEAVVAHLGDASAVTRELDRIRSTHDATLAIFDDTGHVLATSRRDGDAPPYGSSSLGSTGPAALPGQPVLPGLPGLPPGPPPDGFGHGRGLFTPSGAPPPAFMVPVHFPAGTRGRAFYEPNPHVPWEGIAILALVLGVVSAASLFTARSLARPLARLSSTARAFGAGQLDARVGMVRSDEIGDVASAFDEMADRVTTLLRAEKELLANVSHELRTPLSRIRVALDLAAEGDALMAREALGEIADDLGELERLIGDVLTAARLDLGAGPGTNGIPPLRLEQVDLDALLDRAASRFRGAHPDRDLVVVIEPKLSILQGDAVLLRRVIDNLLDNAHKYGRTVPDDVELHAARSLDEVRIEIRDHGIGIAPEDLAHVFRSFFRTDRSRTRATGGLGLGLALARRIVEAHQGTLKLESRAGEGTRAVVRLPVATHTERCARALNTP